MKRGVKSKKEFGSCDSATCTIVLTNRNRSDEEELHTFLHELMHAITYTMGWKRLFKDEMRIDSLAALLLQVLTTAE